MNNMSKINQALLQKITTKPTQDLSVEKLYVCVAKNDLEVVFWYDRIRKSIKADGFHNRIYYIWSELLTAFQEQYSLHQATTMRNFQQQINALNNDPEKTHLDALELLRQERPRLTTIQHKTIFDITESYIQERIYYKAIPGYTKYAHKPKDKIWALGAYIKSSNEQLKHILDTIVSDICTTFSFKLQRDKDIISEATMNKILSESWYSSKFLWSLSRSQKRKTLTELSNTTTTPWSELLLNYKPKIEIRAKK